MSSVVYKKMAGTSAVFLLADFNSASPVERDGMEWSLEELHFNELIESELLQSVVDNGLLSKSQHSEGLSHKDFRLKLNNLFKQLIHQAIEQGKQKPAMATVLALEGLEEYDVPEHGDIRQVNALDTSFIHNGRIKAWIQIPIID